MKAALLLPLSVLLLGLFVTYELWSTARASAERNREAVFSVRVDLTKRRIEERLQAYEQVLRGARALFTASESVNREEFRIYVRTLEISNSYPGIEGIGFSVAVRPEEKAQHIAQVRAEGFPDYDITPPGERELFSSILYLEPFTGRNLRAFGFDMYSRPVRRAAMQQARDTGMTVSSGKVKLVQTGEHEAPAGFLMYMPVYQGKTAPAGLQERRNNLKGWVYAPFVMDDFMAGLDEGPADDLDVEIYDGDTVSPESLMYDRNPAIRSVGNDTLLSTTRIVQLYGHDWTLVVAAMPGLRASAEEARAELVLKGGVSIALLLALTVWLLLDDRARAMHAAEQAMRLALYDVLTGLPNRKLITERLGQAIITAKREGHQLVFMFIDLDKFKSVNDDYGHPVGDLLLKEVAHRLQHCMRQSDTAARLSGDEFVILLPHIESVDGAMVVATKVLQALDRPFDIANIRLSISGSIGMAIYPEHGTDEKTLMRNADTAMYYAKRGGKNAICIFEPGMKSNGR